MNILAIDPGIHGALARLNDGDLIVIHDTPILQIGTGKKSRNEYDETAMRRLLIMNEDVDLVVLEHIHAMPVNGGVGNFRSGQGFGTWRGMLAALQLPLELVSPQRWKKAMVPGGMKGKKASLIRARQLFPHAPLDLEKHDGRAEALLMALYAHRNLGGTPVHYTTVDMSL